MKKNILYFLVISILLSSCVVDIDGVSSEHQRVMLGDNMEYSSLEYDDSEWDKWGEMQGNGVYWARLKVDVPETYAGKTGRGLMVVAMGAYDAYWDGQYIGSNGRVEQAGQKEVEGKYVQYFSLSDSMAAPGKHVLAMRSSLTHRHLSQHAYFGLGNYQAMIEGPLQISKFMFLIAGVFLVTAIYFLFMFFVQRKEYSILLFSVICFLFLALILMEYLKLFYQYEYPFQRTRLEIVGYLHVALSILVPWFFMQQFSFPWKRIVLILVTIGILIIEFNYHQKFDTSAVLHNRLMWFFSIIVVGYACYKREKGSFAVLGGFVTCLLITNFIPYFDVPFVSNYDISLFISFAIISISVLYVMALKRREEQKQYEESILLSERLKNELLKKNIKPHFIMNTLTSLIDWVEESPHEGVKFIQALAGEFEVLNEIADFQLIPITQETKLCKSHLKVMGFRKEINYTWEEIGIEVDEKIPPAIIHTAVENGITHSLALDDNTVNFQLLFENKLKYKSYTLSTRARIRTKHKDGVSEIVDGTGMRYIKSRLQESYPGRWELSSQPSVEGWETTIKIYPA